MLAGLFFVAMNTSVQTFSMPSRAVVILAIIIGTLLLDGFIVAWLWGTGVDFATLDIVPPGGSGFQINPLPGGYQWLLRAVFAANIGLLVYFLAKGKRTHALSFAVGAAIPMGYLIEILVSA